MTPGRAAAEHLALCPGRLWHGETKSLPETREPGPPRDQRAARIAVPVPLDRRVTRRPLPGAVVVAEPALQGLQAGAVKLAPSVPEKRAASILVAIQREIPFVAGERRGEHTEAPVGRHLQHHARSVAGRDRRGSFLHGPPPGPLTVGEAGLTGTRRRRRVRLCERFPSRHATMMSQARPREPLARMVFLDTASAHAARSASHRFQPQGPRPVGLSFWSPP